MPRSLTIALTIATVLVAGVCSGGGHDHGETGAVADDARKVVVMARSFAFDPKTIEVEAGEDVAIVLTSTDITHDFVLDEGDVHVVAAEKGKTQTGGFTAPDEAGEYAYFCSVAGHRASGMEGTLVVS